MTRAAALALALALAASASAECLWPWAATRFAADPASGPVTGYEWLVAGQVVHAGTVPEVVGPCPLAGPLTVRALSGTLRGPESPPHGPVACLGLRPGELVNASTFHAFLPAFSSGWPVCEYRGR